MSWREVVRLAAGVVETALEKPCRGGPGWALIGALDALVRTRRHPLDPAARACLVTLPSLRPKGRIPWPRG
ncbi:MAG: hypothetical protein AB1758_27960 [Candidatus Eremiobacterota bacterium]